MSLSKIRSVCVFLNDHVLRWKVISRCPDLKWLQVPGEFIFGEQGKQLSNLIGRWGNLELLSIEICYYLDKILTPISSHCHKFLLLCCHDIRISDEDAMAIVKLEHTIKYMRISSCHLSRDNLVMILKRCRGLEILVVSYCHGFDVNDEILKLASHIKTFDYKGSHAWRLLLMKTCL